MKGKHILITGATDGIGKQTAIELAAEGASVIIHGRNAEKAQNVMSEIRKSTGNGSAIYVDADLSSLREVKKMAESLKKELERIDVLINNAGVFVRDQQFSVDGIEMTFAVNHLAHYALTIQLLPLLRQANKARVITVSSVAHRNSPRIDFTDLMEINSYIDYSAYALSKMANVMFSNELAQRLDGTGITSNSLHPGVISTKLLFSGFGISGNPVSDGSKTSVFLASHPAVEGLSGKYFSDSKQGEASPYSYDPEVRKNLWTLSEKLAGINIADFI